MGRIGRFPLLRAATALAATVAVAACTATTSAGASPPCSPRGSHAIAHDRAVRVYSIPKGGLRSEFKACLIGRGTRMTLLSGGQDEGLGSSLEEVVFSGAIVAYLSSSFGIDTSATSLTVVDVRTRRVLRNIGEVGKSIDAGFLGSERVSKLVLGADGAVAWITAVSKRGSDGTSYVIHAAARTGPISVLDEGPDIGATSLSLAGHTLSWSRGGIEKSAALP